MDIRRDGGRNPALATALNTAQQSQAAPFLCVCTFGIPKSRSMGVVARAGCAFASQARAQHPAVTTVSRHSCTTHGSTTIEQSPVPSPAAATSSAPPPSSPSTHTCTSSDSTSISCPRVLVELRRAALQLGRLTGAVCMLQNRAVLGTVERTAAERHCTPLCSPKSDPAHHTPKHITITHIQGRCGCK